MRRTFQLLSLASAAHILFLLALGSIFATAGTQAEFLATPAPDDHCFAVAYTTPSGVRIQIDRRIHTGKHSTFR